MSGLSRPPAGVKNFRPLRKNGWWLAVICTAQSQGSSSVAMNIDGVEARPQSSTCTPQGVKARQSAAEMRSAEMRESWPTAIFSPAAGFSRCFSHQMRKPPAMRSTTSSVRLTGAPPPSLATPRMSVPLFRDL